MKTVTENEIKSFVVDVVKHFNPERVILFGSHASGDVSPDRNRSVKTAVSKLELLINT